GGLPAVEIFDGRVNGSAVGFASRDARFEHTAGTNGLRGQSLQRYLEAPAGVGAGLASISADVHIYEPLARRTLHGRATQRRHGISDALANGRLKLEGEVLPLRALCLNALVDAAGSFL